MTARPSRVRVDEPDGAELRDGGGGADEGVGVALVARPLGGVEQHRQPPWVAAVVRRGAGADRQVEHRAGIRWIEGARRIEGAPVVGDGLVVGVGLLVAARGLPRERHRQLGVAHRQGQAGVAGTLGGQPLVVGPGGERGGSPGVQLEPAAHRHRPVAVGAEQGVDEGEPSCAGRVRVDEACLLGRLQRLEHGEQRRAMGGRQQVGVELGTEDGSLVEHGADLVVEELVALVQPDRQGAVTDVGDEVRDEQRVATCLGEDQLGLGCPAGADDLGDLVTVEPAQGDAADRRGAIEVGEQPCQIGVEIRLGVTGGGEDQQRHPTRPADEMTQHVPRGRRRPVEVLDHEEQRLDVADVTSQSRMPSTTASPEAGAARQLVVGDRLEERTVRLVDVLVARPEQHTPAPVVDLDGQLGHEAALADPGLARDDDQQCVTGDGEGPSLAEPIALGGAPDERVRVGEQLEGGR